jgi:mRNA interferase YafQ
MRTIEWTNQFKRDFKRESKGQYRTTLDNDLFPLIELLAKNQLLEARYRDHALSGNWKGHRDCHIKPD